MKFVLIIFCFLAVSFCANAQLTLTWTGGGASDNWSDANNWDGVNTPDATHNRLVFDGNTRTTPFNDLSGLIIDQIQFANTAGTFALSGNSFTLGSGTAPTNTILNNVGLGTETINNSFTLGSTQTWYSAPSIGSSINNYNGNINNNGFTLTTDTSTGGSYQFLGSMSGTGGFISSSNGSTSLLANNTYTGPTTVVFSFFNITGSITSDLTTNPGSFFFDNGTITGNLIVNGGSLDAFKVFNGLATINGNASINGTSYETWRLNALSDDFTGGIAGTNWGEVLVNGGNLTYSPTSTFDLRLGVSNPNSGDPFWNSTRRWLVGSVNSGSLGYSGMNVSNGTWASGYFFLEQQGNNLYLNWQQTPEPSSYALIALTAIFSSVAIFHRKKIQEDVI